MIRTVGILDVGTFENVVFEYLSRCYRGYGGKCVPTKQYTIKHTKYHYDN